jgi:hypothetical protein
MHDLVLNEDSDLTIANGDLVYGESTFQEQQLIISANKGDFKHIPQLGVEIYKYANSSGEDSTIKALIRENLLLDGLTVQSVDLEISKGQINLDVKAER